MASYLAQIHIELEEINQRLERLENKIKKEEHKRMETDWNSVKMVGEYRSK
jgi:hypothetical protein